MQEMENIVFAGAEAAVARIELDGALNRRRWTASAPVTAILLKSI